MLDLHRLPHRLGNALPRRIDQRARRRMRDEDARQRKQQRRILVAARIQAGQRHQHFAPADVGVAEQVERRIGRDEAVFGIGPQQMPGRDADRVFDLGHAGRARRRGQRRRLRMPHADAVHQFRDRLADRRPVRLGVVAGPCQRLAQRAQPGFIPQRREAGPPQQRPQRGVAERGPIKLAEMRVAAGIVLQEGIADVIERRPVLPHRERAERGAGKILKPHAVSFPAPASRHCKIDATITVSREACPALDAGRGPVRAKKTPWVWLGSEAVRGFPSGIYPNVIKITEKAWHLHFDGR